VTAISMETAQAPPPQRTRQAIHWVGEILITLGVIALLFVVYLLFWTNIISDARAHQLTTNLQQQWSHSQPDTAFGPAPVPKVQAGKPFAIMRIPALGASWEQPVIEGVTLPDLAQGVGHYPGTALPGQIGNFAVAGHRATHGQPFVDLNKMRPGDLIIVETQYATYTYVATTNPNKLIVLPTALWVIEPVPGHPKAVPTQALITLTTCNPRWNSSHRMILFGHLVKTVVKT
jgi:sortase A